MGALGHCACRGGAPPADAAGLLLGRAGETGPAAEGAAETLAATLGGLPLALEQAGAYAATGAVTLAGYAKLFGTRALELLQRGEPMGYQHTVATTWSLALERLRKSEPAAVDLLTLMSFLAPDDLPQPLLALGPGPSVCPCRVVRRRVPMRSLERVRLRGHHQLMVNGTGRQRR